MCWNGWIGNADGPSSELPTKYGHIRLRPSNTHNLTSQSPQWGKEWITICFAVHQNWVMVKEVRFRFVFANTGQNESYRELEPKAPSKLKTHKPKSKTAKKGFGLQGNGKHLQSALEKCAQTQNFTEWLPGQHCIRLKHAKLKRQVWKVCFSFSSVQIIWRVFEQKGMQAEWRNTLMRNTGLYLNASVLGHKIIECIKRECYSRHWLLVVWSLRGLKSKLPVVSDMQCDV